MPTEYELGVEAHSARLKAYLRSRLGSEEDAEDAMQEIMYNLLRNAGDCLEGIRDLPSWLYRSAFNLISNLNRRQRDISYDDGTILLDMLADDMESQDAMMLRRMFWSELEKALDQLPAEQRQVWEMTELEGIPVKEIERITGVRQATLLSRKHYAVKHLRKCLRQLYDDIIN